MPRPDAATSDVHTTLRRLPGNAEAAALARRAVEKLPLPDELRDTLWLLVTELVSTSVRGAAAGRAAQALTLQVAVLGRAARAELYDWHPGASEAAMSDLGRELFSALGVRWGAMRRPPMSVTWLELGDDRESALELRHATLQERMALVHEDAARLHEEAASLHHVRAARCERDGDHERAAEARRLAAGQHDRASRERFRSRRALARQHGSVPH